MDIPKERVERVKDRIREVLKENGNQPLSVVELLKLARQKLSNGDIIDEETIGMALEQMISRHELKSDVTGKISKFTLKHP